MLKDIKYEGLWICEVQYGCYRVKNSPDADYALHHGSFASVDLAKGFVDSIEREAQGRRSMSNHTKEPTKNSLRRADYILNHYSGSKEDIHVLARHLDRHDEQQHAALLAALKDTVAEYDAAIHSDYDGSSILSDLLARIDIARKAIASVEKQT